MSYRVLIIGCGAIAGGYDADRPDCAPPLSHAGAFTADDRFEIVACVDPDDAARAAFADRWGIARHAATIDGLHAQEGEFEVVSVCSPTAFHARNMADAIALRPRLVFCEKPVADLLDEARRLVEMCDRSGVALAVNYTRRWAPDIVRLAREVQSGAWGRVLSAAGWYTKGVVHNGGHMIDLLRMIVGEVELAACGAPVHDFWDDDPTVPALLGGPNGSNIHLVAGDARAFTQFELLVSCEKGEFAMRDGGFRIETRRVDASDTYAGYRTLNAREDIAGRYEEAMACAAANIADHLDHGKPLASTGKNALAAQALCEVARHESINRDKDNPRP